MWLKGVTLFCRHHAYANTWLNGEMLFVGVTATPTHFQCKFRNPEDYARRILTCFILQNICIIHRDVADFNRAENEQPDGDNNIDENAYSELGKLKREEIKNYMLNL